MFYDICMIILTATISIPYAVMIIEPFYARKLKDRIVNRISKEKLPNISIIISAYLPNEHEIIMDSIMHLLENAKKYHGEAEILVAYNTPYSMHLEKELLKLEEKYSHLRIIKVSESNSKAENLNYVLPLTKGDLIAVYDADARPLPDALERAARWLVAGYDFVQGSNIIANRPISFLTRIVSAEFFLKFNLSYSARFAHEKITYFCGSNGYWRKDAIGKFLFRNDAFVEDIDCALRSVLNGAKLAYDPLIMCWELAPPSLIAWWHQRLRWAIGWKQLMGRYQLSVIDASWSLKKKLYWSFFLIWRRLIIPIALLILLFLWLLSQNKFSSTALVLSLSLLLIIWLASIIQSLASIVVWRSYYHGKMLDMLFYTLLFPIYDLMRLSTTVVALFVWKTNWKVTPRTINISKAFRSSEKCEVPK